ncbi:MAG TPA: FAD-dependent oxidoreductase [Methylomirabilota bacterium]
MPAATADVVIVGGGVMGTSIALQLARRRAGRIVLCEKRQVASGPTGRSSALLRRHYSIELYARMAARSFELYDHFEELTGRPAEITRCGLVMAVGPEDVAAMRDTVTMMRGLGVKVEGLTPRDLARVVPGVAVDDFGAAAWETDTGYGDPAGVSQAYAARARELGVEIRQDTTVSQLTLNGGRISGVRTGGGDIATATVVNAAGPWGAALSRAVGHDLPVVASRQQLVILRPRAEAAAARPVLIDMVERAYYRPETGGLVLVGTRNRAGVSAPVDPDAFSERVDPDRVAWTAEAAARRFPGFADAEAVGGYASVYDLTPDLHFVIEHSPVVPGLFHALGFSGHGFKHSPVIGEMITQLVMDGRVTVVDAAPFSSSRFAAPAGTPPVLKGRYGSWPF